MAERTLTRLLIIGGSACTTSEQPKWFLVRTDARSQAAHADNGRARQQDGTDRLGVTCKAAELQSSDRSQGVILADLRSSEV